MPTYEYACSACGHEWEQLQRITEPPVELCPKCAQTTAHRLISGGTNFILKGGGWYSDLYASPKAESKNSEAKGGSTPDTAAGGSKTADGKSERKSESKTEKTEKTEKKAPAGSSSSDAAPPASPSPSSSSASS